MLWLKRTETSCKLDKLNYTILITINLRYYSMISSYFTSQWSRGFWRRKWTKSRIFMAWPASVLNNELYRYLSYHYLVKQTKKKTTYAEEWTLTANSGRLFCHFLLKRDSHVQVDYLTKWSELTVTLTLTRLSPFELKPPWILNEAGRHVSRTVIG